MRTSFSNVVLFILLAAVFLTAVLVNNTLLKGFSLDLTENRVYSLSDGSKTILSEIDEPINLYFFFSDQTSSGLTALRSYALQVETLLKKYQASSKGKIRLEIIDPVPFSEAEDRAATFGLTGATLGNLGDVVYFGLAGTNSLDDVITIPFFDPTNETFLEYDLSKLIYQLNYPSLPRLGIVTSLALAGGQNPLTGAVDPANAIYTKLTQLFEVVIIASDQTTLPEDLNVLLIWHPQNLTEDITYAIDQYLMSGGKAISVIDPHYESDSIASLGGIGANTSEFLPLESYGIFVDIENVILDAKTGLEVVNADGGVIRHLGFLGLGEAQINAKDITTGALDSLNGASFSSITLEGFHQLKIQPLLSTSANTAEIPTAIYAEQENPENLQRQLVIEDKQHTLIARIWGTASSHFKGRPQARLDDFIVSTDAFNMVVISDADFLADRFWVQQNNFFGQVVLSPFANNGDLIINLVENYGGSEGLIGIRSRGTFSRPFFKVQELALSAEGKFREQERLLEQRLEQIEVQLLQLQSKQTDALTLSEEEQAALNDFIEQKVQVRRALRDVQYQLNKEIDALGDRLALINIAIAPLILVLLLFFIAKAMKRKLNV